MTQGPGYTKYHPRWHRVRMPIFWWLHRWDHVKFIIRELSSVFAAGSSIVLLLFVYSLARGPTEYERFLIQLGNPLFLTFNVVAFLFVLYHSITWFNLSSKALSLHLGKKNVPGMVIVFMNYVSWLVFSAFLAWVLLS